MKQIKFLILLFVVMIGLSSCGEGQNSKAMYMDNNKIVIIHHARIDSIKAPYNMEKLDILDITQSNYKTLKSDHQYYYDGDAVFPIVLGWILVIILIIVLLAVVNVE